MFDAKHYVPILKWKPAERKALQMLSDDHKQFLTPLIQLIMPVPKQVQDGGRAQTKEEQYEEIIAKFRDQLPEIPGDIFKAWGRSPIFIDFSLIYVPSLRLDGLRLVLVAGDRLGLGLIPVVNLSSDDKFIKAAGSVAGKYRRGICLRLVCGDLGDLTSLSKAIAGVLSVLGLPEGEVDLLVDLQETHDSKEKYRQFGDVVQKLPGLSRWRTVIFASGAFPVDLTNCRVGERNLISRLDWDSWIRHLKNPKLARKPSFGDYAILHPIYKESTQFFSPSASIRYTLENEWLVMRGQRGKFSQYLANAQLLSKMPEFAGERFSYGDAYILEKGKDLRGKPGNATTWLVAGINHHLVFTVNQIANLS